jgi:Na+-transporting NADH:ubiquinone oxidoreductase subunit NqrD
MAEILWHRRETRRQTEKTNFMPVALEGLILLDPFAFFLLSLIISMDRQRHPTGAARGV